MVGWEHSGDEQTDDGFMFNMILQDGTRSDNSFTDDGYGGIMFNMILKDGTRSDNAMTLNGKVFDRYDYFLPENKRITAVTIYYD